MRLVDNFLWILTHHEEVEFVVFTKKFISFCSLINNSTLFSCFILPLTSRLTEYFILKFSHKNEIFMIFYSNLWTSTNVFIKGFKLLTCFFIFWLELMFCCVFIYDIKKCYSTWEHIMLVDVFISFENLYKFEISSGHVIFVLYLTQVNSMLSSF